MTRALGHLRRNTVAYAALIASLGAGTAYAAGKIGSGEIARNAVKAKHVKNGRLTRADFAARALAAPAGKPGPQGPQGVQGPTGPAGPQGPPGPSAACQDYEDRSPPLSAACATPTTVASIELDGPASYLVTATGALEAAGSGSAFATMYLRRAGSVLGTRPVAVDVATGEGAYSANRLTDVEGPGTTIDVAACRSGSATVLAEDMALTAIAVGSASGAS